MGQRRNYSKEFKLEAVNLVVTRGVSVAQACRDLDAPLGWPASQCHFPVKQPDGITQVDQFVKFG